MAEGLGPAARGVSVTLDGIVSPLLADPRPLVAALETVPHTLVHGDWKAANPGSHADGRTGAARLRGTGGRGLAAGRPHLGTWRSTPRLLPESQARR